MKIISKFPDYYDYYAQIFGIDPLIRYERNSEFPNLPVAQESWHRFFSPLEVLTLARFFICNRVFDFIHDRKTGRIFHGQEIADLVKTQSHNGVEVIRGFAYHHPNVEQIITYKDTKNKVGYGKNVLTQPMDMKEFLTVFQKLVHSNEYPQYRDYSQADCPILLVLGERVYKNPILSHWGFGKIIPPADMFNLISNWFLERMNTVVDDNRTDKEKILSHGFDIKTSFRH